MASSLRPTLLYPWFTPLAALKGVGPATLKALLRLLPPPRHASLPAATVRDLLFLLPYDVLDRRQLSSVMDAEVGQYAMLEVTVAEHYPPPAKRRSLPYKIVTNDRSGTLLLTFFHAKGDYLSRQLPVGQARIIGGVVEMYDGHKQISHPDIIVSPQLRDTVLTLSPVYPLTAGISQRVLQRLVHTALGPISALPEWSNPALVKEQGWGTFDQALRLLHMPRHVQDIEPLSPIRMRLAYDETLANQLALSLLRRNEQAQPSIPIMRNEEWHARYLAALPFALTQGQQAVVESLLADMGSGLRMVRLLQGDVGSGKTAVALAAMVQVAASGAQSALMAPTDILARQHAQTIEPLARAMGMKVQLLTGKLPAAEKRQAMQAIMDGSASIVIGTHALFQQQVEFHKLALVVVDEQHRFGVEQRLALTQKSVAPHLLQMTATPIPRSLTMTAYGDMDASLLAEKPAGRQEIDTRAVPLDRIHDVMEGIRRAIDKGAKLYWICPLIEASDDADIQNDMTAVEDRYRVLCTFFGDKVAMMHGRMKTAEREQVMQRFAFGDAQLLVATTVVEVGVNVPEATIMVIEHAERFGLAQLHQLRGRVGRGSEVSRCILLYDPECSEIAKERLTTIRATNDGFKIAEEDLRLRGAGDVLGTRQTGLPPFHFLNLGLHSALIRTARDDAKHLLHQDPFLKSERGQACRLLLELFGYDDEVAAVRSA